MHEDSQFPTKNTVKCQLDIYFRTNQVVSQHTQLLQWNYYTHKFSFVLHEYQN